MRKPKVVIASNDEDLRKRAATILSENQQGIDFDVKTYEDRERLGNLPESQVYIATSLNPDSNQQKVARKLRDENVKCARILLARVSDLTKQHAKFPKASLFSNYFAYIKNGQKSKDEKDIKWREFQTWFRENQTAFQDIAIEGDLIPLPIELENTLERVRQRKLMSIPLKIGVIGLGTLGLGILEKAARSDNISSAHVHTHFVNGDYSPVLNSLDLTGEQRDKIIPHGKDLEEVIKENPDVLLITTGQHGVNYEAYKKREELTEMLFRTGLPKIDPILKAIIANNFQGLIAMQSNPNGHLIKHAMKLGIPREQLTSFSPDTIRHRAELYEYLKELDPKIKEEDILLMAIGEHMKGGNPLYLEAFVKVNNVLKPLFEAFPELKDEDLRREICANAKARGLAVVQSASKYQHDYRGVPQRVKECLEDISTLQRYSRYPIYAGLLSVPAEFTYKSFGDDRIEVRVKRTGDLRSLTKDKNILLNELDPEVKEVINQTKEWETK